MESKNQINLLYLFTDLQGVCEKHIIIVEKAFLLKGDMMYFVSISIRAEKIIENSVTAV